MDKNDSFGLQVRALKKELKSRKNHLTILRRQECFFYYSFFFFYFLLFYDVFIIFIMRKDCKFRLSRNKALIQIHDNDLFYSSGSPKYNHQDFCNLRKFNAHSLLEPSWPKFLCSQIRNSVDH